MFVTPFWGYRNITTANPPPLDFGVKILKFFGKGRIFSQKRGEKKFDPFEDFLSRVGQSPEGGIRGKNRKMPILTDFDPFWTLFLAHSL